MFIYMVEKAESSMIFLNLGYKALYISFSVITSISITVNPALFSDKGILLNGDSFGSYRCAL